MKQNNVKWNNLHWWIRQHPERRQQPTEQRNKRPIRRQIRSRPVPAAISPLFWPPLCRSSQLLFYLLSIYFFVGLFYIKIWKKKLSISHQFIHSINEICRYKSSMQPSDTVKKAIWLSNKRIASKMRCPFDYLLAGWSIAGHVRLGLVMSAAQLRAATTWNRQRPALSILIWFEWIWPCDRQPASAEWQA